MVRALALVGLLTGCTIETLDQDQEPIPVCGDGVRFGPLEECDDGNLVDGDGCEADCTYPPIHWSCANLFVDVANGEVCDDGNLMSGDGCSFDCRSNERCGNGIDDVLLPNNPTNRPDLCLSTTVLNSNCAEVCDDGNNLSGDGCSANCLSLEVCGNGIVDVGEQCDDGNQVIGDGCSATCTL